MMSDLAGSPANQEPNKELKNKIREEGELASSDDDENPGNCFARTTGVAEHSAKAVFATPASTYSQGTQMVKNVSGNNLSCSIDIQPQISIQPNSLKSFEQNEVTFKSNTAGWFPSSGTDNNLVISFSDDDSVSDTEDHRRKKPFENKSNATEADGNGRPPISSAVKVKNLQQNSRKNVSKVMPKKFAPGQTLPVTRNHGGANSWVSKPASVEQRSQVRNFNINKRLGSQEHGCDQRVGLRNSKLQDLRHQIALRESELKLKAAQQNKGLVVDSCENVHVGRLEQKEPDKKRLKVGGTYYQHPTNVGQQDRSAAKSIVPAKEPTQKKSSLHDTSNIDRCQKDIPIRSIESDVVKWDKQNGKEVHVLPENVLSVVKVVANSSTSNQSDRDSRQVIPGPLLHETAQVANTMSCNLPKNVDLIDSNHVTEVSGRHPSSFLNNGTREQNLVENREYSKALSGDKTVEPSFNNIHQVNTGSLWNFPGNVNVFGHSNMDAQSLLDMEEHLDKELEEAQDHRRVCEIEERKALKAYRNAQRALIEANARCTKLYRRRELCSAQCRSFIMDNSNLLWSSGQHETLGNDLDLSKHISGNKHLVATSTHQMQSGCVGYNQGGYYDSLGQCVNSASLNEHENGQNLGSDPCSEPDASTSEPMPHKNKNALNEVSPHSNELMVSADEDEEMCQLDQESVQPNFEYQQKDQIAEGRKMSTDNRPNNKLSVDSSQDPLLLEETLRSELFSRLGMKNLSNNSTSCFNVERPVELRAENNFGSDKMQMSDGSVPSAGEQNQQHDIGGTDKPERNIHEAPVQIQGQCHVGKSHLPLHLTSDSKRNKFSTRLNHLTSLSFSPPILRSAFGHLKSEFCVALSNQSGNQHNHRRVFDIEEGACANSGETQDFCLMANSKPEVVKGNVVREMGSYTCNLAVDPLWPLCMYELRGKCNNDKCPWQHVNYFSDRNKKLHDDSDGAGCQIGSTISREDCNGGTKFSKGHNILSPPTYIVGLDILKADSHSYKSVVARRQGQCWQICLSISLALSSIYQKDLPADFLHISVGRIEWQRSWNGQSSYFQSRNGIMNQLKQVELSNEQCVEMALLILNQETNKLEGTKKALSLLSRAIEADPKSEILWIIYLLIFYSNTKSVGKDDMFSFAVKYNEESYGLWLMYINSRIRLNDRLDAYDAALSVLCHSASASDGDEMHASACILDLFLQMVECFHFSGNTEKAIQRISGLFLSATDSNDRHSLLLSDIITCLTISDKLIFWVCCVYMVIYRKLPDAVLQCFECEKELLAIEWPSVELEDDEKQRAIKLLEMAVDSVELHSTSASVKDKTNLRSAHNFAVNHIRCMAVLNGLECCRNLLEKYIMLYPSCLELVLISARLQKHDFRDLSFDGFEEALIKWPKGLPGTQCIWNQYAEHALQNGRRDFAVELMDRWFHSVWKVQHSQVVISDPIVSEMSSSSPESTSTSDLDFSASDENQMDVMFGYLNLSLHKLLQNDCNEARLAMDAALKAAVPEHFKHCVREHAILLLLDESEPKEDGLVSKLLNCCLDKTQSLPYLEPLPRKFINNIERPRVRQLIANLLTPNSSDFSLVNLVLEVSYGPYLLPQKFNKLKDLVDFVEDIMEIVPSNYQLAFSVFKLLNKDHNPNITDAIPESVMFWASSSLVSAIFHAVPIAPEYVWTEAAGILGNMTGVEEISECFYKRALSVYPFSIKLWKCYYNLSKIKGDTDTVVKAAREKGIELD